MAVVIFQYPVETVESADPHARVTQFVVELMVYLNFMGSMPENLTFTESLEITFTGGGGGIPPVCILYPPNQIEPALRIAIEPLESI